MFKFQPPISDGVMSKLFIVVDWVSQNTRAHPAYSYPTPTVYGHTQIISLSAAAANFIYVLRLSSDNLMTQLSARIDEVFHCPIFILAINIKSTHVLFWVRKRFHIRSAPYMPALQMRGWSFLVVTQPNEYLYI